MIQGQNLTLAPKRGVHNSNNGSIRVRVLGANVQGIGPFSNNSNVATFVDNLTSTNLFDKVWIKEHEVLSFQKVKQKVDRSVRAGQCWQSCRGLGTALDERF